MVLLKYGDSLRLECKFEHIGAAFVGAKIRAAIGNKGFLGFDEILHSEVSVGGIKDDLNWVLYQIPLGILITTSISPGKYEVYAKLMSIPGPDIFWYGPADDIQIEAPIGEAEFQNLTVSYSKS